MKKLKFKSLPEITQLLLEELPFHLGSNSRALSPNGQSPLKRSVSFWVPTRVNPATRIWVLSCLMYTHLGTELLHRKLAMYLFSFIENDKQLTKLVALLTVAMCERPSGRSHFHGSWYCPSLWTTVSLVGALHYLSICLSLMKNDISHFSWAYQPYTSFVNCLAMLLLFFF